jgi:trehalose 6-phosphate phosphatase
MKPLFSKDGLKILESLCFTPTLFAFDYDGTLAKIVPNPSDARISERTATLLKALDELAPVGVISGRATKDLKPLLSFRPRYLIGNHGLEGLRASKNSLASAQNVCRQWKRILMEQLKRESGLMVEDKEYSLAVHYRYSRAKSFAKLRILEVCGELDPPPRIIMGKCVVNLIPTGAPHKGMALLELMLETNTRSAFYIGDDDTDEDVFALPDARILSVRVGKKSESAAHFFIERQTQINKVLTRIIGFLKG